MRSSDPTDASAQLSGLALMREFRSFGHTEKVGEAAQRKGVWGAGMPASRGGTHLRLREGEVSDELGLRRR